MVEVRRALPKPTSCSFHLFMEVHVSRVVKVQSFAGGVKGGLAKDQNFLGIFCEPFPHVNNQQSYCMMKDTEHCGQWATNQAACICNTGFCLQRLNFWNRVE